MRRVLIQIYYQVILASKYDPTTIGLPRQKMLSSMYNSLDKEHLYNNENMV